MAYGNRMNVVVLGLTFIPKDCQAQDDEPYQKEKKQGWTHFMPKIPPFFLEKEGNTTSFVEGATKEPSSRERAVDWETNCTAHILRERELDKSSVLLSSGHTSTHQKNISL